jgi:DNA helicase-2/ATP-dependent DNA helicase PcrA
MNAAVFSPAVPTGTGWFVTVGPPGTGKTTHLLDLLRAELEAGTPPDRIAFVSFTRAARLEAVQRVGRLFGLGKDELPWFRTIHSTAYRLLDLGRGRIMTGPAWREFAEAFNYKLTDSHVPDEDSSNGPAEPPRRSADDLFRYVYEWGRNRRLDTERSMGRCPANVPAPQFRDFVRRLEDFKRQKGLLDFTDVLDHAIEEDLRPDVDVAFIDEAQDLSPLQIAVVEQWFAPCVRVYVGGDDDQAIYSFQGAEPDWLLGLAARWPTTVLTQSHRVPGAVHAVAQRIIHRNRRRIAKSYQPAAGEGAVERLSVERALRLIDGGVDTLVLARNRMFLQPLARDLFERRLPYVVEGTGGVSPLSSTGAVRAVRAAHRLWRGEEVDAGALGALLAQIPSRGPGLLPRGVKARAKERKGTIPFAEIRDVLGLVALLEAIRRDGPASVLLKLKPDYRTYFQALLDRHGDVPTPRVRLTSIHAAKGREADLVVVLPDMTRATYLEYLDGARGGNEAENRVAYVAVTRAKRRLVLIQPTTQRHYHYPSATVSGAREGQGKEARDGAIAQT